jgi:hypothetical protein
MERRAQSWSALLEQAPRPLVVAQEAKKLAAKTIQMSVQLRDTLRTG